MTGTCDICDASDVELSRSDSFGIETWSCAGGCSPARLQLRDEMIRDTNNALRLGRQFNDLFNSIFPKG